jgi:hypothetical protein
MDDQFRSAMTVSTADLASTLGDCTEVGYLAQMGGTSRRSTTTAWFTVRPTAPGLAVLMRLSPTESDQVPRIPPALRCGETSRTSLTDPASNRSVLSRSECRRLEGMRREVLELGGVSEDLPSSP